MSVCPTTVFLWKRTDLTQPPQATALAAAVERLLRQQNSEYAEKRDTRRLGPHPNRIASLRCLAEHGTKRGWHGQEARPSSTSIPASYLTRSSVRPCPLVRTGQDGPAPVEEDA